MYWIDNFDKLVSAKDNKDNSVRIEFISQEEICGQLNFQNKGIYIVSRLTGRKDYNGFFHYCLKLNYASHDAIPIDLERESKAHYFFPGDVYGELLSLISLCLRARLYVISSYRDFGNDQTDKTCFSNIIQTSYEDPVHQLILEDRVRNFAIELPDFLENVIKLSPHFRNDFMFACYSYLNALRYLGKDRNLVYIYLILAIEAISQHYPLRLKKQLRGSNFEELFPNHNLTEEQLAELKQLLSVNKKGIISFKNKKTQEKFIDFISSYIDKDKYLNDSAKSHIYVSDITLKSVLENIYNQRSKFLHCGRLLKLSGLYNVKSKDDIGYDWHYDMVKMREDVEIPTHLPYEHWFEGVVRDCLLKFLERPFDPEAEV
jgi:hypothetical protein